MVLNIRSALFGGLRSAAPIGKTCAVASCALLLMVQQVAAAVPAEEAAGKSFFEWLTTSVTGFIAAGATVAIIVVLAVGLYADLRKDVLVRIIAILIAIGVTPVAVEKATSGWSFSSSSGG